MGASLNEIQAVLNIQGALCLMGHMQCRIHRGRCAIISVNSADENICRFDGLIVFINVSV